MPANCTKRAVTLPSGQHPYTPAELRRTMTSVIKRVQQGKARPLYVGLPRSRLWSSRRPQLTREEARARQLEPLEAANRSREATTAELYLAAARRLLARGEALTARNMARETGRSIRKVRAHATTWRSIQTTPSVFPVSKASFPVVPVSQKKA